MIRPRPYVVADDAFVLVVVVVVRQVVAVVATGAVVGSVASPFVSVAPLLFVEQASWEAHWEEEMISEAAAVEVVLDVDPLFPR